MKKKFINYCQCFHINAVVGLNKKNVKFFFLEYSSPILMTIFAMKGGIQIGKCFEIEIHVFFDFFYFFKNDSFFKNFIECMYIFFWIKTKLFIFFKMQILCFNIHKFELVFSFFFSAFLLYSFVNIFMLIIMFHVYKQRKSIKRTNQVYESVSVSLLKKKYFFLIFFSFAVFHS